MRLLTKDFFSLNGANHGFSLLLGDKFDIKSCLKDSSKFLSSLFGQTKIGNYS